jgi:hypothetical protein
MAVCSEKGRDKARLKEERYSIITTLIIDILFILNSIL